MTVNGVRGNQHYGCLIGLPLAYNAWLYVIRLRGYASQYATVAAPYSIDRGKNMLGFSFENISLY